MNKEFKRGDVIAVYDSAGRHIAVVEFDVSGARKAFIWVKYINRPGFIAASVHPKQCRHLRRAFRDKSLHRSHDRQKDYMERLEDIGCCPGCLVKLQEWLEKAPEVYSKIV